MDDAGRPEPTAAGPSGPEPAGRRPAPTLADAVGLVFALVGFVVGAEVITDNSLLTHLATGRLIVEQGAVPTVDPYSVTAAGRPWTVQSWLASVVYAVADGIGGGAAIRLVHGLIGAALVGALWQLTAPARHIVPRAGLAAVVVALGAGFWSPRPLMFGLLAMVGLLQVVELRRPPWLMVPIMWFWVNTHGSFPLAFVFLGAVIVGSWLDGDRPPRRELRVLAFTAVGVVLGALNPLGPRLLWFPVALLRRREALEGVVEWGAPSYTSLSEALFLVLLVIAVVAAARGARWRTLLPAVGFLVTGLVAIRNINVAVVVVVAMAATHMAGLYGRDDGSGTSPVSRALAAVAAVGLAVGAVAVALGPGFDLELYPTEEVDWLEDRDLVAVDGVTLVHRDGVGNYLGARFGADARVFIDDRFDFYPLDLTADHLALLEGGDNREILDRRSADVVLWEADTPLSRWLAEQDDWATVLDGDEWVVACRLDSPVAERCR